MGEILFSIIYGGLMILVILFIQSKLKKEYATYSEKASNKEGNKQEVIA